MRNAANAQEVGLTKGPFALLMAGLLTTAVGQSFIFAILPPLGREVQFSELQINSIIAFSALIFSVGSAWWGRLSDQLGRKPVILIGLFGYACGTVLFALSFQVGLNGWMSGGKLFALVMVVRCTQSVIMSATNPGTAAYAADRTDRLHRTRALARLSSASSLGLIAGPAIAGALASFGLLFPLYFAAALAAFAALAIAFGLPPDERVVRGSRDHKKLSPFDPRLRAYLLCSFMVFTGFAGIQQTLGFRLQDMLDLSGTETVQKTGLCLMVGALCTFGMQMTVAQRFQGSPMILIRIGSGFMLAGATAVALASNLGTTMAGMASMGAGLGLVVPAIAAAASLAVSNTEQGAAAGLVTAIPAAGFVLGPLLCGSLYSMSAVVSGLAAATILVLAVVITIFSTGSPASSEP